MVRKHLHITSIQNHELEQISTLDLPFAEHVRRAIDEYLDKHRKKGLLGQRSPSKMKIMEGGREVAWATST